MTVCIGEVRSSALRGPVLHLTILFSILGLMVVTASAGETAFPDLRVVKNPGAQTGVARTTIKGKSKVLCKRAVEAWQIMDGENALVAVLSPRKSHGEEEYHLRFYVGATRKYRDLGIMHYAPAQLVQKKESDGNWVFAMSGRYLGKPTISLTGMNGINGELRNASEPQLHDDLLTFLDANGNPKTLPIGPLLARDMTGIYEVTGQKLEQFHFVQFLRTGTAILIGPDGEDHHAIWRTNGEAMIVTEADGTEIRWPRDSLRVVSGIPAGTRLVVRLLQPLSSERSKKGTQVDAVLISPATVNDSILMPQGTVFHGAVVDTDKVGWGFRHERAGLTLEFTGARFPDGSVLPVHTLLDKVENARETVNDKGKIKGVRATGTAGYAAEKKIASVATINPIAYLFTNVSASAVLGFADPEIRYPAGTEMLVQFVAPAITAKTFPRAAPEFTGPEEQKRELLQLIRDLPFRTMTKGSNKPSDITNLVFIGPPDGWRRAFKAAGWVQVDELSAGAEFSTIKTVGGNHVYNEAPMSTLLLDELPPVFSLSKTTNTFASRHHLRVFDPAIKFEGVPVLTSSSTQDIRVAFSRKQKTFIHVIDEYIDNERSKVVNDLQFTGCVEWMNVIPRSWVPRDAYNSTGDRLVTDGAAAVMKINDCQEPHTTPDTDVNRQPRGKRITRDTVLTIRDDLYRGNLIYTGVSGVRWVGKYFATKDELKPETGAWRTTDSSGTQFSGLGEMPTDLQRSPRIVHSEDAVEEKPEEQEKALERSHRWDPAHYEIGILGGYMRYPTNRNEVILFVVEPDPGSGNEPFVGVLADEFARGWNAGISVTVNSWKWFSNQFTYTYNRGVFRFVAVFSDPPDTVFQASTPLLTHQFEYNLLWNLRPPKSRWRPYAALGPAIVLTHLAESPVKKAPGPFKIGLQNLGLLIAAYNFGNTRPLEGGGVFSPGVVYGAGFKFRVHPRLTWSVDFRETLSKAPNFLSDSYTKDFFGDQNFNLAAFRFTTDAKYRQQRFTTGFAFTF